VDYLPISARERDDVEDVADIIYVAGKSPFVVGVALSDV